MARRLETCLYEILLRFDADGLRGAHVQDLDRILDGDEVVSEIPSPARAVTVAEVGDLLGKENVEFIGKAVEHREAVEQARDRAAEAEARASQLATQLEAMAGQLADAQAQVAARESQLEALAAQSNSPVPA